MGKEKELGLICKIKKLKTKKIGPRSGNWEDGSMCKCLLCTHEVSLNPQCPG